MMHQHSQSGVAMLEVLISIVVISFGFLSLLNMQLNMLSSVSVTSQHFLASSLAHDMGERIRSNKPNLFEYNSLSTSTFLIDCDNQVDMGAEETEEEPEPYICSMAEEDFFQWQKTINDSSQSLLNGVGEITTVGGIAKISLSWSEKR